MLPAANSASGAEPESAGEVAQDDRPQAAALAQDPEDPVGGRRPHARRRGRSVARQQQRAGRRARHEDGERRHRRREGGDGSGECRPDHEAGIAQRGVEGVGGRDELGPGHLRPDCTRRRDQRRGGQAGDTGRPREQPGAVRGEATHHQQAERDGMDRREQRQGAGAAAVDVAAPDRGEHRGAGREGSDRGAGGGE